jgi:hypothetical protein
VNKSVESAEVSNFPRLGNLVLDLGITFTLWASFLASLRFKAASLEFPPDEIREPLCKKNLLKDPKLGC